MCAVRCAAWSSAVRCRLERERGSGEGDSDMALLKANLKLFSREAGSTRLVSASGPHWRDWNIGVIPCAARGMCKIYNPCHPRMTAEASPISHSRKRDGSTRHERLPWRWQRSLLSFHSVNLAAHSAMAGHRLGTGILAIQSSCQESWISAATELASLTFPELS